MTAERRFQRSIARGCKGAVEEPEAVLVPSKHLRAGDKNGVRFHVEGRGTFGYAVTLTGFTRDFRPDQNNANRTAILERRVYLPAEPELDGKTLPAGFSVAVNASYFENVVSQVGYGGRARVDVQAYRNLPQNQPEWERDFLIVEEHVPAGASVIDGSVQTTANLYTLADGVLTFYFAPDQWPNSMRYDVYGEIPGRYRALPASIRSAYDPGRVHLAAPPATSAFSVPGESANDPYKATPDELYARSKAQYDAGRLDAALRQAAGGAVQRLHAPRRRPEGRGPDALAHQHQAIQRPQGRPVLRGREGEGPRAGHHVRRLARDRPRVSRYQRI